MELGVGGPELTITEISKRSVERVVNEPLIELLRNGASALSKIRVVDYLHGRRVQKVVSYDGLIR
ncbi:MAG TPA: hypothetical protein VGM51_15420 [Armatimonadota bacterium]